MTRVEYLLTLVMEECSEITKLAAKAQRFTPESVEPNGPPGTNAERLAAELTDLLAVAEMLREAGVIPEFGHTLAKSLKRQKVEHFMKISRELRCLDDGGPVRPEDPNRLQRQSKSVVVDKHLEDRFLSAIRMYRDKQVGIGVVTLARDQLSDCGYEQKGCPACNSTFVFKYTDERCPTCLGHGYVLKRPLDMGVLSPGYSLALT